MSDAVKKTDEEVKRIIEQGLRDAAEAKYCLNCRHSYIQDFTGAGHCKYEAPGAVVMLPKPINEWAVCTKWEAKTPIEQKS